MRIPTLVLMGSADNGAGVLAGSSDGRHSRSIAVNAGAIAQVPEFRGVGRGSVGAG